MNPETYLDVAKQRHQDLMRAADDYRLAASARSTNEPRPRTSRVRRLFGRPAIAK
jgi:hypothetical protein